MGGLKLFSRNYDQKLYMSFTDLINNSCQVEISTFWKEIRKQISGRGRVEEDDGDNDH